MFKSKRNEENIKNQIEKKSYKCFVDYLLLWLHYGHK